MAFNCIYADGSVIAVDTPWSCPLDNNGVELIDVANIHTTVDVTTPEPVSWAPLVVLAMLYLLSSGRKR